MRDLTENLWSSTSRSNLYCVWVSVHHDGGNQLVAIWIDRALTAFKSCAPATSDGIGTAATHFASPEEEDVNLLAREQMTSLLPRRGY